MYVMLTLRHVNWSQLKMESHVRMAVLEFEKTKMGCCSLSPCSREHTTFCLPLRNTNEFESLLFLGA